MPVGAGTEGETALGLKGGLAEGVSSGVSVGVGISSGVSVGVGGRSSGDPPTSLA